MSDSGDAPTAGYGQGRRVVAVLVSLVMPGAGHFVLGAFRRGVAWAIGLQVVLFLLLFSVPTSLVIVSVVIVAAVFVVGRVAAAIDAARLVRPRPSWTIVIVAWVALLVGALALTQPLRASYGTHYLQAFAIPSVSMQPTLLVGDYIVVDKSAYRARTLERGDIVLFEYPPDARRTFAQRVIGLPGDMVAVHGEQAIVNGRPFAEPYLDRGAMPRTATEVRTCGYAYACEPTRVPAGSYFVLGDNRNNSLDSRYWGFVTRERIQGKASLIYWSWDSNRHWLRIDRVGRSP